MGVKCAHYKLCSVQSKLVYFFTILGYETLSRTSLWRMTSSNFKPTISASKQTHNINKVIGFIMFEQKRKVKKKRDEREAKKKKTTTTTTTRANEKNI